MADFYREVVCVRDCSEIFYLPVAQRKEIKIKAESPAEGNAQIIPQRTPRVLLKFRRKSRCL
jgi:hypothetical protein